MKYNLQRPKPRNGPTRDTAAGTKLPPTEANMLKKILHALENGLVKNPQVAWKRPKSFSFVY